MRRLFGVFMTYSNNKRDIDSNFSEDGETDFLSQLSRFRSDLLLSVSELPERDQNNQDAISDKVKIITLMTSSANTQESHSLLSAQFLKAQNSENNRRLNLLIRDK